MIICHCKAVCDRQIETAVLAGATCLDSIASFCAAGSNCGGCRPSIEALLECLVPEPSGTDVPAQRSAA